MSTTMAPPQVARFDDRHAQATLWHVIRSEWVKFWSVRSTAWTLIVLFIATVGISVLASVSTAAQYAQLSPKDKATIDVPMLSVAGIGLSQLAIAVLGAMIITTEYSTGGIRTTLSTVPSRMRVLFAKGLILAAVSLVIGLLTTFVSFYASEPFWQSHHLAVSINDPGVLRAVIGAGLYIMASALFGFALGTLLRHTAAAITLSVALLLIVPPLLSLLPGKWGDTVYKYFTSTAGDRIISTLPDHTLLSPWAGYLTMTIWWAALLALGAWLMNRRDA